MHTAILPGMHLNPSHFRSEAWSGPVSIEVGDHLGTLGRVRFLGIQGPQATHIAAPDRGPVCRMQSRCGGGGCKLEVVLHQSGRVAGPLTV